MGTILQLFIAMLSLCRADNGGWIDTHITATPQMAIVVAPPIWSTDIVSSGSMPPVVMTAPLRNPNVFVRFPPERIIPNSEKVVVGPSTKQNRELAEIMRSKQTIQSRVIGGEMTTIEKLGGYLVALRFRNEFICGGTLVDERFVVSAAHCFLGRPDIRGWTIDAGITRLSDPGVRSQLLDYVVPSVFKEKSMHMDVAVLLLKSPLRGTNIAPAALCQRKLDEGLHLTVSGWGLTDPNASSPFLSIRTVTVPIIAKSQCRQTYKRALHLTQSMFCAGVLGSKDACTFDSGGPLVYSEPSKPIELCGIVSFGISCASPKFAGVYTDVNYVKPFIEQTIKTFKESKAYST